VAREREKPEQSSLGLLPEKPQSLAPTLLSRLRECSLKDLPLIQSGTCVRASLLPFRPQTMFEQLAPLFVQQLSELQEVVWADSACVICGPGEPITYALMHTTNLRMLLWKIIAEVRLYGSFFVLPSVRLLMSDVSV
jgi:hypothetical protein